MNVENFKCQLCSMERLSLALQLMNESERQNFVDALRNNIFVSLQEVSFIQFPHPLKVEAWVKKKKTANTRRACKKEPEFIGQLNTQCCVKDESMK
ncbi:hypothetical protein CEXT_4461 [Caerostris extrusa]|uniref:Uncharacterized protein n=1 Tax=Caerostris extrusa TaxID=172846 RepID=A0AAV4N250_CAEEX|nr:hypothetical protein CEXT_4461 [Caerostris extrusa]